MCTVLLPPAVNSIAVNKYISYHIKHNNCITNYCQVSRDSALNRGTPFLKRLQTYMSTPLLIYNEIKYQGFSGSGGCLKHETGEVQNQQEMVGCRRGSRAASWPLGIIPSNRLADQKNFTPGYRTLWRWRSSLDEKIGVLGADFSISSPERERFLTRGPRNNRSSETQGKGIRI